MWVVVGVLDVKHVDYFAISRFIRLWKAPLLNLSHVCNAHMYTFDFILFLLHINKIKKAVILLHLKHISLINCYYFRFNEVIDTKL